MKNNLIYEYFSDDDFLLISDKISEMEKMTSGEIRISMPSHELKGNVKPDIRKLAEEEFYRLNMQATRDKTGILIYLNLRLKQFYILADSGINDKVDQEMWDNTRNELQNDFQHGNFVSGVINCIDRVGKVLSEHFPIKHDDTNEISNQVVI